MESQQPKHRDVTLSSLNAAIDAMNLAKEAMSQTPAKAIFGSVSILLTMVRDSMLNKRDYIDLGLDCANICGILDRGMNGKKMGDLSQSVCEAVNQLAITVAEIQRKIIERSARNAFSQLFHAKNDKETIATWRLDLNKILHIFNTELSINTYTMVADLHRTALAGQEGTDSQHPLTQPSTPPGEFPPPPPRACFGRDDLIEKIVNLVENHTPIALIGTGGIGKTSVALTVLHHGRIKEQFGDNRWFICCDQFPASHTHFLNRLSKVIGAGIENPEDLTPLRPFLSSREMILFLDNAESIFNSQEIYAMVEELGQFSNICLCITSRISAIPTDCETLDIPTLSMEAAHDTFCHIYKQDEWSNQVHNILEQLDFHPLSITLLATVAQHNKWGVDRLVMEWRRHRTSVLHSQHKSLAATIELSLASPMFQELGPDAYNLLGVVAFFPQGVNENHLDWLFPTIPNRRTILDKFCVLSLTYQSNGFITMLAPLRDYLSPKDPASSPLLRITKGCYFSRLLVNLDPHKPDLEEAKWITSEDVNVEHLLDVFMSIDGNSVYIWAACCSFMDHLFWHKRRLIMLGPKIEGLQDDHILKPKCLFGLSQLFDSVGNHTEHKRLLFNTLKLWRERGNDPQVASTLICISNANRLLGLRREGMGQAEEALGIYERLGDMPGQSRSLQLVAWFMHSTSLSPSDEELNVAEIAASIAIKLLPDEGEQFEVCQCHRLLGSIYCSKGEMGKAIDHFEAALGIAFPFGWRDQLFWNHYSLAQLFFHQQRFGDAHAHVEHAKSHAVGDARNLGHAMSLQVGFWYFQHKLEEAKSEALRAADVYEMLGSVQYAENCRTMLWHIEEAMKKPDPDALGSENYLAN